MIQQALKESALSIQGAILHNEVDNKFNEHTLYILRRALKMVQRTSVLLEAVDGLIAEKIPEDELQDFIDDRLEQLATSRQVPEREAHEIPFLADLKHELDALTIRKKA